MSDQSVSEPSVVPPVQTLSTDDLRMALRLGWRDFTRAPLFGLAFSLFYVIGGLVLYAVFIASGQSWWFIPIVVGFPIFAPFAATGLYDVSRRLEGGLPLTWGAVLGCVMAQKDRQVPSMAMVIMLGFMFWVFVAHTIFALFFGLQSITSSTGEMLMTANGLSMLVVGGAIGGAMAAVFFALTVVSLPLLLDKELDFITAMITSVATVTHNPKVMAIWAALIAVVLFLAMLPAFIGLFIALPVLGHATWHLYRRVLPDAAG